MFKISCLQCWELIARVRCVGLTLFLVHNVHAASGDLFEEIRQQCLNIERASRAFEEDNLLWAQEQLHQLGTLSEQALQERERTTLPFLPRKKRTLTELRAVLAQSFATTIEGIQINLRTAIQRLTELEELDPLNLPEQISKRLAGAQVRIDIRMRDASIPSTLSSDMEHMPDFNKKMAQDAILRWANEALVIKTLSRSLSANQVEALFRPVKAHPIQTTHFLVLQAYALDLVESPPIPDHFRYNLYTSMIREAQEYPQEARAISSNIKEKIRTAYAQLGKKDIQTLGRVEEGARKKLSQYNKGEIVRSQWRIDALVDQSISSLLSLLVEEMIEEEMPHWSNAQLKKARAKQAKNLTRERNRAEAVAAAEAEKKAQKERAHGEDELPLAASATGKEPKDTLPVSTTAAPDISAAFLAAQTPQPVLDRMPSPLAAVFIPLPPRPQTPEEFRYQPFVRDAAQGGADEEEAAAAAAIAAVPSLKPRLHALWEQFWRAPWMEWTDFTKLFMNETLGFGINPMGGSIRHVIYPLTTPSTTGKKYFVVHEPHGDRTTLGPNTLGDIREHLARDFGWSLASFQAE